MGREKLENVNIDYICFVNDFRRIGYRRKN